MTLFATFGSQRFSLGRNGEFAHILMEDVHRRTLRRVYQLLAVL